MKKYVLYLLILTVLISCKQRSNQQTSQTSVDKASDSLSIVNDPKSNLNIQTNSFTEIDSSGILMFPLSMGETEREGENLVYKKMPNNAYWNIIFYNSKTKEYKLLSDRKIVIENYEYGNSNSDYISQSTNYIFYTARTDDFNNDKILSDADPTYLFVSDKLGKDFRQISPTGYNLYNWKFIKNSNKVVLTAGIDSDKNHKFDDSDEVTTFEIELDKDVEPKKVFPDEFKNKLKILFDKDWKRLKK